MYIYKRNILVLLLSRYNWHDEHIGTHNKLVYKIRWHLKHAVLLSIYSGKLSARCHLNCIAKYDTNDTQFSKLVCSFGKS